MAVLSRKTCGLAIEVIEKSLTGTSIEKLLYEQEIPEELISGTSKAGLLLNVFRGLEQKGQWNRVLNIIQAALKLLQDDMRRKLEQALMHDGFVATDSRVVPEEIRSEEHKTALEQLVAKH